MSKAFKIVMVIGAIVTILDQFHIGWYLNTGNKATDLSIGWVAFIGASIFIFYVFGKNLGWFEDDEEETPQQEEKSQGEEIYSAPVKKTWWNDWYEE